MVISPISGKFNRPTLLVSRNKKVNSPVKAYIRNAGFTSITAIGGERFVPYSVFGRPSEVIYEDLFSEL